MDGFELSARLGAGLLLILTNAFFVAIEFALTRARQYDESEFDEPGLQRAWEMTDDLEIYLTSCQVGITASSIAVGIVAEPALASLFDPLVGSTRLAGVGFGSALGFVLLNLVHLTHGEQTPTYLGVERSKQVCRYGATPLYWFTLIISPLIKAGDGVAKLTLRLFGVEMTGAWLETETDAIESRAELRNRLDETLEEAEDSGEITPERHEEVINAFEVGEEPVREILVPRENIASLSADDSPEETLSVVREHPHARFPLVGDDVTDFRGIVYLPALTANMEAFERGETTLEELAAPPLLVDATTTVSNLIDRFQEEHQELALVEEGGDIIGLVTATDAFEAVMGELEDPLDERGADGFEDASNASRGA